MTYREFLAHIGARRRTLRSYFDIVKQFEELEESCVPSYCHGNIAAAYVAWWRLYQAVRLANERIATGHVLDFGAATGELRLMLPGTVDYDFIEEIDILAKALVKWTPTARRQTLSSIGRNRYNLIFALDSLEHNENFEDILSTLQLALRDDGLLVLSGPTENRLYKLGRSLSGFDGHYHHTNIYDIERAAETILTRVDGATGPLVFPLFSISVWRNKAA